MVTTSQCQHALICECQTEMYVANNNNLFIAMDKDQHDCVYAESFLQFNFVVIMKSQVEGE